MDAVAAYRRETAGEAGIAAAVEAEPVAEPPPVSVVREGYSTDTPEPDWIAEEDLLVPSGALIDEDEEADAVAAEPPAAELAAAEESAC